MTRMWWIRGAAVIGTVVVLEAIMVTAGMGPRLMLVAGVVMVASAVVWLALDLGAAVQPAVWRTRATLPAAGTVAVLDTRSWTLRMRLARTTGDEYRVQQLHVSLVELIDDRLLTEHLVDRRQDPLRAEAILGSELNRFVNEAPSPTMLSEPREIARIVTLIENV